MTISLILNIVLSTAVLAAVLSLLVWSIATQHRGLRALRYTPGLTGRSSPGEPRSNNPTPCVHRSDTTTRVAIDPALGHPPARSTRLDFR